MARFKVHHSEDACCIDIRGDVRNPEPSQAVISFPGGSVEVSRHSDGSYWVHVARNTRVNNPDEDVLGEIVESRIDHTYEARQRGVPPMPAAIRRPIRTDRPVATAAIAARSLNSSRQARASLASSSLLAPPSCLRAVSAATEACGASLRFRAVLGLEALP